MNFNRVHFDPSRAASTYLFNDDITLAVNAAIETKRVLLVEGLPGSGKSTLAKEIAEIKKWRYYERVITSRTTANDLLWEFDAVQRLADAHTPNALLTPTAYVQPQALWWALAPSSARCRGAAPGETTTSPAEPPQTYPGPDAVVLLDEIDKADPDMPNDLLVPLGEGRFEIRETHRTIEREGTHRVLIVVTSNGERALAPAFVRRCVRLELKPQLASDLVEIAGRHLGITNAQLHLQVATWCIAEAERATKAGRRAPSTAEFLDLARAAAALAPTTTGEAWEKLARILGTKPDPTS